jgi:hypothetical protein
MSNRNEIPLGIVPRFSVRWASSQTPPPREIPAGVERLLRCLSIAIEDYIEGDGEADAVLRYACQRAVGEIASALRVAHWPVAEATALVTEFIEWSLHGVFCESTDATQAWLTRQSEGWIAAVYTPVSSRDDWTGDAAAHGAL